MKNKIWIIITIILIIVIGVLIFFLFGRNNSPPFSSEFLNKPKYTPASDLSEQPDLDKFNEYFTNAWIGKLPEGTEFNPASVEQTQAFITTDQFCTSLDIKKTIAEGSLAVATYDINTQEYVEPKGVFPMELKQGNTLGCEPFAFGVGKYESKIYIDDVLAIVLPFEIK